MLRWVYFLLAVIIFLPSQVRAEELRVITASGAERVFDVQVANTDAAREQGLMGVKDLAPNTGMLFVFDTPRMAAFWMRGTLIPLDMLYITADGVIADIHAGAVPHDETPIRAAVPVISVLEIVGGTAEKQQISVGDRVISASLGKGLETK